MNSSSEEDETTPYNKSSVEDSLSAEVITDRIESKNESNGQEDEMTSSDEESESSAEVSLPPKNTPNIANVKIEHTGEEDKESVDASNTKRKRGGKWETLCPPLDLQRMPRAGTMFHKFPRSVGHNCIRVEEKYLRKLKRSGLKRLRSERKKRKLSREQLQLAGLHDTAKNNFTLQTSSSDDAYVEKTTTLPLIDWENAEWGSEESLCQRMESKEKSEEVCSLIGWATHLTGDTLCPQNNLLDFPNTPLPPSMLDYIHRRATASRSRTISWRKRTFKIRKTPSNDKSKRPMVYWLKRRVKRKWKWQHGIDDKDYQWMKENFKPRDKTSVTVPVGKNDLSLPLTVSGQIALGMVVEEVITASLMPFARLHAANCRQKVDAFHHWTVPPEEAILSSPETSHLPSASNAKDLLKWCYSRGLDYKFVKKNSHLYSKILAISPSTQKTSSSLKTDDFET